MRGGGRGRVESFLHSPGGTGCHYPRPTSFPVPLVPVGTADERVGLRQSGGVPSGGRGGGDRRLSYSHPHTARGVEGSI